MEGEPLMKTLTTISADCIIKTFQLSDGTVINCHIYDTAGQERYRSLGLMYYKKADAALLVYDISQRESFEIIKQNYINTIKEYCKKDIIVLLLGNKADLEEERKVSLEEGVSLALQEDYEFKESSCKNNINVAGVFEYLVERWNYLNHKKQNINKLKRSNTSSNLFQENIKKKNRKKQSNKEIKIESKILNSFKKESEEKKQQNISLTLEKNKNEPKKKKCC